MKVFPFPLLNGLALCILLGCTPRHYSTVVVRPASCSQDVQFAECATLGHLLEFADKMRKPVFLDFYTPWVENCRIMDQTVFTQDDVASYFNNHFINYKINVGGASPGPELADLYGVTKFPTFIFLDGKGKIMLRHEGPVTAKQLLEMGYYLHNAVEKEMVSIGSEE